MKSRNTQRASQIRTAGYLAWSVALSFSWLALVAPLRAGGLDRRNGATILPDRQIFDGYAQRANFPGAMQIPEVKFTIVEVDGAHNAGGGPHDGCPH